ncbi:hypothetical protein EJB05_40052, partial [Eragrostis curvula]
MEERGVENNLHLGQFTQTPGLTSNNRCKKEKKSIGSPLLFFSLPVTHSPVSERLSGGLAATTGREAAPFAGPFAGDENPLDYSLIVLFSPHTEAFKKVPVLVVHISHEMVEEVTKAALSVFLRILLIHKLLGTGDLLIWCKTMNASYRYPCFFRIQNGTVHNSLDSTIAQDFHVVSNVDMQCMWELLDRFPAVAAAIKNFKALTTCEQDTSLVDYKQRSQVAVSTIISRKGKRQKEKGQHSVVKKHTWKYPKSRHALAMSSTTPDRVAESRLR